MKLYGNVILVTLICVVIFWVFMALRPAHADCCDMAKSVRAPHAFQVAAQRQFGGSVSNVHIYRDKDIAEYAERAPGAEKWLSTGAWMVIKDARYLGVDEQGYQNEMYFLCSYRTRPVIRFYKCSAWEGD